LLLTIAAVIAVASISGFLLTETESKQDRLAQNAIGMDLQAGPNATGGIIVNRGTGVGADVHVVVPPGVSATGVRVIKEGPGSGLTVIQGGPGTGLKSTVEVK
jgi:hypothetical protein